MKQHLIIVNSFKIISNAEWPPIDSGAFKNVRANTQ